MRRSEPSDANDRVLEHAIESALPSTGEPLRVAVAYSGGGDSTALLHAVARLVARGPLEAVALHVHHGLHADADAWLAHCRAVAEGLGIPFDSARVQVERGGSIEGEARRVRYAALVDLARTHRCSHLLTAHHADDQAETVLVNLARGTGIAGLAAAARSRTIEGIVLARPFLDLPSAIVRGDAAARGLAHVDDPSNHDRRFTRNAIRHDVLPALRRIAPSIAAHLARTAAHASTLQALLDEIGDEDLAIGEPEDDLAIERLAALSPARAANALRVWLGRRGMRAPSAAALAEMLDQLLHASPGAQIALLHEQQTLRLYRGRVIVDAGRTPRRLVEPVAWHGESRVDVPTWHGSLHVSPTDARGFDAGRLRAEGLVLRQRRGGERMRMRVDGPSRTLKNLYQEAGIAAWERERLPLVYCGDQLLQAAGLGPNLDATVAPSPGVERVTLEWRPDPR